MSLFIWALAFIQILVISIVVPTWIRQMNVAEMARYPESEFPLLYTLGTEVRLARQRLCQGLNYLSAIICIGIISWASRQHYSLSELSVYLSYCLLIQLLPFSLTDYWEWQVKRLRKQLHSSTVRKATLATRRLNDIISPYVVLIYCLLFALVVGVSLFLLATEQLSATKFFRIVLINTVYIIHTLFLLRRYYLRPRQDPVASMGEELMKIKRIAWIYVGVGVFISFSSLMSLSKEFVAIDGETIKVLACVTTSLFMQAMFILSCLLRRQRLYNSDYSVYKAPTTSTINMETSS